MSRHADDYGSDDEAYVPDTGSSDELQGFSQWWRRDWSNHDVRVGTDTVMVAVPDGRDVLPNGLLPFQSCIKQLPNFIPSALRDRFLIDAEAQTIIISHDTARAMYRYLFLPFCPEFPAVGWMVARQLLRWLKYTMLWLPTGAAVRGCLTWQYAPVGCDSYPDSIVAVMHWNRFPDPQCLWFERLVSSRDEKARQQRLAEGPDWHAALHADQAAVSKYFAELKSRVPEAVRKWMVLQLFDEDTIRFGRVGSEDGVRRHDFMSQEVYDRLYAWQQLQL